MISPADWEQLAKGWDDTAAEVAHMRLESFELLDRITPSTP